MSSATSGLTLEITPAGDGKCVIRLWLGGEYLVLGSPGEPGVCLNTARGYLEDLRRVLPGIAIGISFPTPETAEETPEETPSLW